MVILENIFNVLLPREISILRESNPFLLPRRFDESTILRNETNIGALSKELLQRLKSAKSNKSLTEVVSPLITYMIFLGSAAKSFNTETTLG